MAVAAPIRPGGGWRGLGLFWLAVLAVAAGTVGTLAYLGPPAAPADPAVPTTAAPAHAPTHSTASAPAAPGGIVPPQTALLEPSRLFPPAMLPRVAADGRVPRIVYARPAAPDDRPKVAIVIGGLGMSAAESRAAIEALPGPVSLAFSPYASDPRPLLALCRQSGHETLVSLPLEPAGFPLDDAGSRSLLTGASPQANAANLEWTLSRMEGYVGAIGALDGMRGERFADIPSNLRAVLDELSRRGLLYVDPRPGKVVDGLADVPGRAIDAVVDDPQARAEIEAKLAGLERTAREKGTALGFAGPLRPATVERIAAWANGLGDRGIALVPASALINGRAGAP